MALPASPVPCPTLAGREVPPAQRTLTRGVSLRSVSTAERARHDFGETGARRTPQPRDHAPQVDTFTRGGRPNAAPGHRRS
ncbi:hypothetical protein AB0I84_50490, partial [Streptomyces spectabilis]|uniref:hypothetical protein n=1 Tax=Streptomyces spectabilis TaxID=68270 RepID=UPI0033ECDC05